MASLTRSLRLGFHIGNNIVRKVSTQASLVGIQNRLKNVSCQNSSAIIPEVYLPKRLYSSKPPLTLKFIEERVLLVLRLYDKVDPNKLSVDSHFLNDLGLDSLDHVEVIMAMEDEFGFEIPDVDADKLLRPKDIVQYIADKEDIYE